MNQLMLRDFTTMRTGIVAKTDLLDIMAPHVREVDPEAFAWKPDALSSVARAPQNGYRLIDNRSLMQQGLPEVHALIREIPDPYREVFRYLETEYGLIVPVGMEDLGMFMVAEYRASPAAFGTVDVRVYTAGTVSWTKPAASRRWTQIWLLAAGGGGGGGSKVTTSGNQAGGGGGGGGGGAISRFVTLASLSTGNVVVGSGGAAGGTQSNANTNGNTPAGTGGGNSTFASLTAGGGAKGTGGAQGAGAQTGAGGAGGTGDVAGTAGGTGRSSSLGGGGGGGAGRARNAATTTGAGGAGGVGADGYAHVISF
jgi:hypothetical protein